VWINAPLVKPTVLQLFSYPKCNTLHLRSKEFQRIHLSCIPQHWETSKCTLKCIPGKWLHFQRNKPLSSKQELPWCGWGVSVCFIQAQIIVNCGNKSMFMWWIRVLPEEALKWRNFGVLSIIKVRKWYCKVRTSLTAHSQVFQNIFECPHYGRHELTAV